MHSMIDLHAGYLGAPIHTRAEVLTTPCPVPTNPGVYGWWFETPPARDIDMAGCYKRDGLTLLYAGISPSKPPTNGKAASRENIRKRITYHYRGNAAGSTLRLTLGSLLSDDIGIQLRRIGSGNRFHFHDGERALDDWMAKHALVSWVAHPQPWVLEDALIKMYDLPLNLMGNRHNAFHSILSQARSASRRRAMELPVLPNPGRRN